MPTSLSVNLNKIALLRNARGHNYPSLEQFATQALENGAKSITLHPRPDQRHARQDDVRSMKKLIETFPGCELNVEGYPSRDFLAFTVDVCPHQCTLVPDHPDQITSDHGFDPATDNQLLQDAVQVLSSAGIRISLFVDPDPKVMPKARAIGVDRIELFTETWAHSYAGHDRNSVLDHYRTCAQSAHDAGLEINAGHDLNTRNLPGFLTIPGISEVSIGHALIVEALEFGFNNTVRTYVEICKSSASRV